MNRLLKPFFIIIFFFMLLSQIHAYDEEKIKKFNGEVLFVNGDWIVVNLGAYHNLKKNELLYVYRDKKFVGSVRVRKIRNLHSICKIEELKTFHILEKDVVNKDLKNISNLDILKLSITLNRLNSMKSRMKSLLKGRYPTITDEELVEFIEWFYIQKGVIFDLTSGTDIREVVSAIKDPDLYIKKPLWLYYKDPGRAHDLIMYNEISYEVWKNKIDEFIKHMASEKLKRRKELERRLFILKRENDIKSNPYYYTFVKYFGEPDVLKKKFYSIEVKKLECSWHSSGVYAEFVNNRLVKREKYKNSEEWLFK